MAFFGITQLGPQNAFLASRKEHYGLDLFTIEECRSAFAREAGGSMDLLLAQVRLWSYTPLQHLPYGSFR